MTDIVNKVTEAYVEKMNGVDETLDDWMSPKVDNMKTEKVKNGIKNYSDWANRKLGKHRIERWEVSSIAIIGVCATTLATLSQYADSIVRLAQNDLRSVQQGLRSVMGGDYVWSQGTGYDVAMTFDPFFSNSAEIIRNASDVVSANACGIAAVLGVATVTVAGAWFFTHYKNQNKAGNDNIANISVLADKVPNGAGVKHIYTADADKSQTAENKKEGLMAKVKGLFKRKDKANAQSVLPLGNGDNSQNGLTEIDGQKAEPVQTLDTVPVLPTVKQDASEPLVIDYIPDSSAITKESDKNLIQEVDDNFINNVDLTEKELMEVVINKAVALKDAKKDFEESKANLKGFRMARDFENNIGLAKLLDATAEKETATTKAKPYFPKALKNKGKGKAVQEANILNMARYKFLGKQREM